MFINLSAVSPVERQLLFIKSMLKFRYVIVKKRYVKIYIYSVNYFLVALKSLSTKPILLTCGTERSR